MADVPNNPAARLLAIVEDAQRRSVDLSNRQVWSEVFGIPPSDTATLLRRLATLSELPNEAAAVVATVPDEPEDERLRWKPHVEEMLHKVMSNIDAPWRGPSAALETVAMYSLRFWAKKLALVRPEPMLDDAEVKELHRLVRELIEQVLGSALEPDVKEFLLDQLRAADTALQEYRIRGAAGVVEAIHRMAGRAWAQEPLARKAGDTPEGRKVGEILMRLVKNVGEFVRTASSILTLYSAMANGHALPTPPVPQLLNPPRVIEGACEVVAPEGPGEATNGETPS
jgi:hypothetical protein